MRAECASLGRPGAPHDASNTRWRIVGIIFIGVSVPLGPGPTGAPGGGALAEPGGGALRDALVFACGGGGGGGGGDGGSGGCGGGAAGSHCPQLLSCGGLVGMV